MKDKLVPVLVALVVISAFAVGLLYGKVSVYEKGGGSGSGTQAGDTQPAETGNTAPQAPPEQVNLDADTWEEVTTDPAAVIGEDGADIVMVEFTDYQCPFCARYFEETYGQVVENFVDTGRVQYMVRDLPLSFHQNAKPAAIAARCAGEQDAYVAMHDALFEFQDEWVNVSDTQETFVGYASELGINTDDFTTCLGSEEIEAQVDADLALANKVGATGTPTFFINGTKLVGAQPYAAFESVIEEELAE